MIWNAYGQQADYDFPIFLTLWGPCSTETLPKYHYLSNLQGYEPSKNEFGWRQEMITKHVTYDVTP